MTDALPLFVSKMKTAGLDTAVIDTFSHYYRLVVDGETGLLSDRDIDPVQPEGVENAAGLHAFAEAGERAAGSTVVIILNGGLGTSMGLTKAKSLVQVKDGRTFLDIKVRQAENSGARLAFMNSFNTHGDTLQAIADLAPAKTPDFFVQNKFPKILRSDFTPAQWPKDPRLEWNPPGHGDIYTALLTSGLLAKLIENGIRYAFISNSDNLGATLDFSLLGYFSTHNFPFMMEVAERTPADLKGGHLARLKTGQFVLREIAQCPKDEIASFENLHSYRYFNTNNIWVNLSALKDVFQPSGVIFLPLILNPKTVDPRDKKSPKVYQIETAMGAAISLFQRAAAVKVDDSRFHPVKKCNDLLSVRSDCYRLTEESLLLLSPQRARPPVVKLDPRYFGHIDAFEKRFQEGVPSLIACDSLTIEGDVFFEKNISIKGSVTIKNTRRHPHTIKNGTLIDRSITI